MSDVCKLGVLTTTAAVPVTDPPKLIRDKSGREFSEMRSRYRSGTYEYTVTLTFRGKTACDTAMTLTRGDLISVNGTPYTRIISYKDKSTGEEKTMAMLYLTCFEPPQILTRSARGNNPHESAGGQEDWFNV
jgi:hypothetical protein